MKQSTVCLLAVTRGLVGETLTTPTINALVHEYDPSQNLGSLCISDHTGIRVNGKLEKQPNQREQYATLIFEKVGSGRVLVVPASDHVPEPIKVGGRGAKVADPAELARLRAKQSGKVAPAPAPVPVIITQTKPAQGGNGLAVSK